MDNYFFKIQDVKNDKKQNNFLKNTQKKFSDFFGIDIRFPNVFLIDSRKQYDCLWKIKSEDWMVGEADGKNIFILNPKIYTKESSHKNIEHFWKTLKHEYCHIAIRQFCGCNKPKWLNEGLCCYLSNQEKKEPIEKDKFKIFDYFQKSDWQIYEIGYYWIKLLIDKFGKDKLLELIKSLHPDITEKEFAESFKKVYEVEYSKKGLNKNLPEVRPARRK